MNTRKNSKMVELANEDLALACVAADDVEAEFFLRGLELSEKNRLAKKKLRAFRAA